MKKNKTVVAIATSVVGSTIGVIRLTGKESLDIVNLLLKKSISKPRYSYLRNIYDGNKILDNVLIVYFEAPKSYTGEHMVEIYCHGGYITTRRIYELLLKNGADAAGKGEFSKRAFFNGKMDLIQVDAVNNLINATNSVLADNSIKMMNGIFSRRIIELREKIIEIIAYIEAYIDFPEDDVEEVSNSFLQTNIDELINSMENLISSYNIYQKIKEGISVAIVGKPNSGKSSLLNAILKEDKAIVTHIPGTTRDVLEHSVFINGMNVLFFDTAGIRESDDIVENIGIEKARKKLEESDIVIYILDGSKVDYDSEKAVYDKIRDKNRIVLKNKIDIGTDVNYDFLKEENVIELSLKTGEGFDIFEKKLSEFVAPENFINKEIEFFIDNVRYINSLSKVKKILESIKEKLNLPLEYIAEDLKDAKIELSEIIGEVYHDDILDKIFSTFCIGK